MGRSIIDLYPAWFNWLYQRLFLNFFCLQPPPLLRYLSVPVQIIPYEFRVQLAPDATLNALKLHSLWMYLGFKELLTRPWVQSASRVKFIRILSHFHLLMIVLYALRQTIPDARNLNWSKLPLRFSAWTRCRHHHIQITGRISARIACHHASLRSKAALNSYMIDRLLRFLLQQLIGALILTPISTQIPLPISH